MIDIILSDPQLTTFVKQQAKDLIYYSPAWLNLISRTYGFSLIPLTSRNAAGQISGYLPLCSIRSPLTGHRLVSFPFSDHCPLLAVDASSANDLIDQAIQLAQQHRARYLELRTGVNDIVAKRSDLAVGNLYVRWLLPLTADPDTFWSGLRKPIQKRIKRARRLGVQIRTAQSREDMGHFYRLHVLTRSKKLGMPAQPRGFFFGLWNAFAANGTLQLLLAEFQGTIIASAILLASGTTLNIAYSASHENYLDLAPNNLLFWTAMTLGCMQGYQTFDMGRTACDNEGLMEFKHRWGAIQEPLPYYYYPHIAGLAATSEQSRKFRLLTSCWKRLPPAVAGPLGGHLYRHLG
jgi:FemAB-related protein (PEP-CTERM system-associated)